jgi:PTH2 family peptidyl-tRNA hydrolase
MNKVKQVIVIRKDLKMRRGKEIAQGSHASNQFLMDMVFYGVQIDDDSIRWAREGFTKICVTVDSLDELMSLHNKAKELGLKSHFIEDEGVTEFHNIPTVTALAIGPNTEEQVNQITGGLKLY